MSSFRGSLTRSHASRGTGLNRLVIGTDQLRVRRWLRPPLVVPRAALHSVSVRRIRLPLWWTTEFTFDCDAEASRYIFTAFRPRAVVRDLKEQGWPVDEAPAVSPASAIRRMRSR